MKPLSSSLSFSPSFRRNFHPPPPYPHPQAVTLEGAKTCQTCVEPQQLTWHLQTASCSSMQGFKAVYSRLRKLEAGLPGAPKNNHLEISAGPTHLRMLRKFHKSSRKYSRKMGFPTQTSLHVFSSISGSLLSTVNVDTRKQINRRKIIAFKYESTIYIYQRKFRNFRVTDRREEMSTGREVKEKTCRLGKC